MLSSSLWFLLVVGLGVVIPIFGEDRFCRSINRMDCSKGFVPNVVCANDGVSYPNDCAFSKALCKNPDLKEKYNGPCVISTEPLTTTLGSTPEQLTTTRRPTTELESEVTTITKATILEHVTQVPTTQISRVPTTNDPTTKDSNHELTPQKSVSENSNQELTTQVPTRKNSTQGLISQDPATDVLNTVSASQKSVSFDSSQGLISKEPVTKDSKQWQTSQEHATESSNQRPITEDPVTDDSSQLMSHWEKVTTELNQWLTTQETTIENSNPVSTSREIVTDDSDQWSTPLEVVTKDTNQDLTTQETTIENSNPVSTSREIVTDDSDQWSTHLESVTKDTNQDLSTQETTIENSNPVSTSREIVTDDSDQWSTPLEVVTKDTNQDLTTQETTIENSNQGLISQVTDASNFVSTSQKLVTDDSNLGVTSQEPTRENSNQCLISQKPVTKDKFTKSSSTDDQITVKSVNVTIKAEVNITANIIVTEEPAINRPTTTEGAVISTREILTTENPFSVSTPDEEVSTPATPDETTKNMPAITTSAVRISTLSFNPVVESFLCTWVRSKEVYCDPSHKDYACGNDNRTYRTRCDLAKAHCDYPNLSMVHDGICPGHLFAMEYTQHEFVIHVIEKD